MPLKIGTKTYKKFAHAKAAIKRKKGISGERAAAYVAAIERSKGKDPRSGKPILPIPTSKKRRRGRK